MNSGVPIPSMSDRSFGVQRRLVLGVAVLIALLLILAVGASWQFRTMGRQLERIVQVHDRQGELAHRLNAAQLAWMERLRALLVVNDPDDLRAQLASLRAAQSRYAEAETALGTALQGDADVSATRVLLEQVRQLRESITPMYDVATRTMVDGAGTEGALALLLPAEAAEARWRRLIDAIVESAADATRTEFEAAGRRQRLATAGLTVVTAATMLAALLMATALVRSIVRPIAEAVAVAEGIAHGRLDHPIDERRDDEFGRLASALAVMQRRLHGSVLTLSRTSTSVLEAGHEIAAGSLQLSERARSAAGWLAETTSAVQALGDALDSGASAARGARTLATGARVDAQRGHEAVETLVAQMQRIEGASRRITEIVAAIDTIAFQTHLLALNASVEAARAGEQGRGFAVVAAAVRELAHQATEAAGQIRTLSAETSTSIAHGTTSVAEVDSTVNRLMETLSGVARTIEGIAATSVRQGEALARIDDAVVQLGDATHRNVALAEQLSVAASSLQHRADDQQRIIAGFHLVGATESGGIGGHASSLEPSADRGDA